MRSKALLGKSGTSKNVASAAGNPEPILFVDCRFVGLSAVWGTSCDKGLCTEGVLRLLRWKVVTMDTSDGLDLGC